MKGITAKLRALELGEQIEVNVPNRDNLYVIAKRLGIKLQVEKFVNGFIVTRIADVQIAKPIPHPGERVQDVLQAKINAIMAGDVKPVTSESVDDDWQFNPKDPVQRDEMSGYIYRKQYKPPAFKQTRTVRVDDDDFERIIKVM